MKIKKEIESIDDVEFELLKEGKLKQSSNKHEYVNNKELLEEFIKYKEIKDRVYKEFYNKILKEFNVESEEDLDNSQKKLFNEALSNFIPPKLSDKIGAAIIQVATRRCNSRQYIGYSNSWKEELISNAIMTASIRCHNFDPEKSSNPFAYITQICDNAIKEQIKKEKKQLYVKYKTLEETNGFNAFIDDNINESDYEHQIIGAPADQRRKFIEEYEKTHFPKKEKSNSVESEHGGLSDFF